MTLARKSTFARPRIYYVNPLELQGKDHWSEIFDHAASLGFDAVMTAPPFERVEGGGVFSTASFDRMDTSVGLPGPATEVLAALSENARDRGVSLMLDVVARAQTTRTGYCFGSLDPRVSPTAPYRRVAPIAENQVHHWAKLLSNLSATGISGYRLLGLEGFSTDALRECLAAINSPSSPKPMLSLAYTPGMDFGLRKQLQDAGLHGVFSSLAWWDLREPWFLDEFRLQENLGLQIAFPEAPFQRRLAHGTESLKIRERKSVRAVQLASEVCDGILISMGFEFGAMLPLDPMHGRRAGIRSMRAEGAFDITAQVRTANQVAIERDRLSPVRYDTSTRVTVITQSDAPDLRVANKARFVAVNRDLRRPATLPLDILSQTAAPFFPIDIEPGDQTLAAGEVRVIETRTRQVIATAETQQSLSAATSSPRLAIERIEPRVDDGRFPVKRVIGDTVTVEADIFADGHDLLAASLLYRAVDEQAWRETNMVLRQNDRWSGAFPLERLGRYEFCVEAWKNPFAIFRHELFKKHEALLDLRLELIEGEGLVKKASASPAKTMELQAAGELRALLELIEKADSSTKTELLLSLKLARLMAKADRRPFAVRSLSSSVDAERREAAFASWYQVFPRSQSGDPERHGTFDDVIKRLPAIRDMGFDVLYFPPIHPIGLTNRKGRNNILSAGPNDPGSPYAIGSAEGGHEAVHAELGGFDAFRRLMGATKRAGLELALDLAIQASPDHPWLKQHPGWFEWRPDGTIRYAENPPKKYEDIVNVDFYAKDSVPALWQELRDIVQLWVDEGVKLFRVDNPHTKPFPFWEWLIGDIRARHPEVVFLSEAFTRPKVMYRLAKIGFSQSYTYFTWRNSKWELEQYMSEITQTEVKEYFRPHFFVNTHDINPDFLQDAPRSAYLIRAALAATLSGLWGVYNGFELCEGRPDAKRKEYADSEKYEIKAWDYDRPGNIKAEITMLNRIRRTTQPLHSHLGLALLSSSNPNVMFFEKAGPGRHNVLLIAICLNPDQLEESRVEIPLWKFGQGDGGSIAVEDLVSGTRFSFAGKWQTIRLDPEHMPFAVWRVRTGEV